MNRGLISVEPDTLKTSLPKVFAVGDVTTGPKTVVAAIADGKKAAVYVDSYMTGQPAKNYEHPLGQIVKFDASSSCHSQSAKLAERPTEER